MSIYIKPLKKWEKSKEVDEITETKTVAQVENGYIIVIGKSGYKGEGEEKEYFDESKAFISETNPLDEDDMKAGLGSLLSDF